MRPGARSKVTSSTARTGPNALTSPIARIGRRNPGGASGPGGRAVQRHRGSSSNRGPIRGRHSSTDEFYAGAITGQGDARRLRRRRSAARRQPQLRWRRGARVHHEGPEPPLQQHDLAVDEAAERIEPRFGRRGLEQDLPSGRSTWTIPDRRYERTVGSSGMTTWAASGRSPPPVRPASIAGDGPPWRRRRLGGRVRRRSSRPAPRSRPRPGRRSRRRPRRSAAEAGPGSERSVGSRPPRERARDRRRRPAPRAPRPTATRYGSRSAMTRSTRKRRVPTTSSS